MKIADQIVLLKKSGLFDEQWYVRTYPDVLMSGIDPIEHYVTFSGLLNRPPNSHFSKYLVKGDYNKDLSPAIEYLLKNSNQSEDEAEKLHAVDILMSGISDQSVLEFSEEIESREDNFALYRVIGNDLFPRHEIGQSRKNLEFILKNEKDLPACKKFWIVNRIVNKEEKSKIISLLDQYNQEFIEIEFKEEEYRNIDFDYGCLPSEDFLESKKFEKLGTAAKERLITALYRKKNIYVMNNNGARNTALVHGRKYTEAKWILPWDGNCFVTESAWESIKKDIIESRTKKHFLVPMARIPSNDLLLDDSYKPDAAEEPQMIFRRDSKELFNAEFCYGRRPKVEMFWRLGVPGVWDTYKDDLWDQKRRILSKDAFQYGVAGWTARLFSGMNAQEKQNADGARSRFSARQIAIVSMLSYLDSNLKTNNKNNNAIFAVKEKMLDPMSEPVIEKKESINKNTLCLKGNDNGILLVNRPDGLGERLKAILNGIYLSEYFGLDFKFTWPVKSGIDKSFHDIETVSEIFSKEFIEKYYIDIEDLNLNLFLDLRKTKLVEVPSNKCLTGETVGWICHQSDLSHYISTELLPEFINFSEVYNHIGFSTEIEKVLKASQIANIPSNTVAIHLRGGDIIYGKYRLSQRYQHKVIPVLVALQLAKDIISSGKVPLIFAQDKALLDLFRGVHGVITTDKLIDESWSSLQKAMFEIDLMSKCSEIISGSSGFAAVAAKISNNRIKNIRNVYSESEQYDFINKGLESVALDDYQKSYHLLMCVILKDDDFENVDRMLAEASLLDPGNGLYLIKRVINNLKYGFENEADKLLESYLSKQPFKNARKLPIFHALEAKNSGKMALQSDFVYFKTIDYKKYRYLPLVCLFIYYLEGDRPSFDECINYLNGEGDVEGEAQRILSSIESLWV